MARRPRAVDSWLWDELILFVLLGGGLAIFADGAQVRNTYRLPQAHLVLNTAVALTCLIVAVLAGVRYSVDARRLDLLLTAGFGTAAAATFCFDVAPLLGGDPLHRTEAWAGTAAKLLAAGLIAGAAFARGTITRRRGVPLLFAAAGGLLAIWLLARALGSGLPPLAPVSSTGKPLLLTAALAVHAMLSLLALVGFGGRYHARRADLDRWLTLASTLALFAQLHYVFTPLLSSDYLSQGDLLRLLSYVILLAGVWRAIRAAEHGRAVAEERGRVAREIHDGLAQYLFALSTQVSLLEHGANAETVVPRLKEAAALAQQEARFAVLALSSAGGSAPFDAALRRYVEFLTADGVLEVDVEIDETVPLGPDEQIELFRIVQEGLANVRKHSGARHAVIVIGLHAGRRRVTIEDDGDGFEEPTEAGGHGLRNMRARAATIGGSFRLSSQAGAGTELEITLRA